MQRMRPEKHSQRWVASNTDIEVSHAGTKYGTWPPPQVQLGTCPGMHRYICISGRSRATGVATIAPLSALQLTAGFTYRGRLRQYGAEPAGRQSTAHFFCSVVRQLALRGHQIPRESYKLLTMEDEPMEQADTSATETQEVPRVPLAVLHAVKTAQNQHGLRHGDHKRYKSASVALCWLAVLLLQSECGADLAAATAHASCTAYIKRTSSPTAEAST